MFEGLVSTELLNEIRTFAGGLGCAAFFPLIISIFKRTSTPSIVTWAPWAILDTRLAWDMYQVGSLNAQMTGIVIGVWVTVLLLLWRGTWKFSQLDYYCIAGAVAGIATTFLLSNEEWRILLISIVLFGVSLPSFEHGWNRPEAEDTVTWVLAGVGSFITLLAVPTLAIKDIAQPIAFVVITVPMIIMLLWPRTIPIQTETVPTFTNSH